MKMRQLRTPIIVAGLLGLVILCLVIAIIDQQMTVSRLGTEVAQAKRDLSKATSDVVEYQQLTRDYDKLSLKLGGRYRDVSWSRQMPAVINQLTGIMQTRGLKIETLRPDPITAADSISRLPLRISFKAGLGDMAKVVQDIETTVPLLEIERLDIRTAGDKSGQLDADMTVSSFAITDENAPGTAKIVTTALKSSTSESAAKKSSSVSNSDKSRKSGRGTR